MRDGDRMNANGRPVDESASPRSAQGRPVTATPPWLLQKERGSSWLMRLIAFVGLRAGRAAGRAMLYPICAYFMVFSRSARAASMDFLARVRQQPCGWRDVFAHYHR